ITFLVQRSSGAVIDIDNLSLNERIANAFLSYAQYIAKMFWPANLAVFYPFAVAARFPLGQAAICAFLLLVISIFIIYFGRRQKYLPLGWFWFVGTLVPVIGLVQVGLQTCADRYTYIPYIGLFIIIAWSLPQILSKLPYRKIVLGVSMVIVLTTLGICAHRQTSYWKNSFTLFSHALAVTQNNWLVHNILGVAYYDLGRDNEAIAAYEQAIKIKPDLAMAHYNLGLAYGRLGHDNEAIAAYKQAIKIKPDYTEAHDSLGVAYARLGRWPQAIDASKQAIRIKPDLANAHKNLGNAYYALGRYPKAIESYKQVIRITPDDPWAYYNLGLAYLATGDKNSALTEYNILKSLNPQLANKLLNQINK
ncbi:MAG: tetratricopeptide repeat protein, partial [Sedimentisphaerales bacterium]